MPIETDDPERDPSVIARLVPRTVTRAHEVRDRSVVIGSGDSADVRETDRSVQPRHARLIQEDDRWYVEDLNSGSGTFLNGQRIVGRTLVVHGDALRCGSSLVELVCELAARAPAGERRVDGDDELARLRERLEVLDGERAERDARIARLGDEARALGAELAEAREQLARSRGLHEAALADVRHELARERHELRTLSGLHDACCRELAEVSSSAAELRLVIDAQQMTAAQPGDAQPRRGDHG